MKMKAKNWFFILMLISLPFQIWAEKNPAPVSTLNKPDSYVGDEVISLDQCLKLGYQNSRQLVVAAQNVAVAEEGLRQANGGFLPTLNYSLSDTNPPTNPTNDPFSGSLTLSIYLYNGGKITTGVRLAQIKLAAAQEELRKAKQQLIYNIKTAYYSLWLAQQMLVVAQSSYDNMGQHYEHVNKANRLGMATKFDLMRARIQWEKLKPPVMKASHAVDLAKITLSNCIGLDTKRPFKAELDIADIQLLKSDAYNPPALHEEACKSRPEMREAEQLLQIAECNVKLAEAGYKPAVTLSQKYSGTGFESGGWKQTLNLTANLSGALFDGLATTTKVAAAKDNLKIAQVNQGAWQDQIKAEVEAAYQNFEEAVEMVNYNQTNIAFAKESIRVTQSHFDAGMATTLDIADAQLNLDTTLNGYYQGLSSYLTSLARLDLVLGKDIDQKLYEAK